MRRGGELLLYRRVQGLLLLSHMRRGQTGRVFSYLEPRQPVMRRLLTLGLTPGEKFMLERSQPDYLIRFGWTRIAINERVAREILIQKLP